MNHGIVKNFRFNPEMHVFLFSGTELRRGMRVLLEDAMFRTSFRFGTEPSERDLETARWCRVGRVEVTTHPEWDESGQPIGTNTLVSFEAIYDDGHVIKRRYNSSFAWYAEKPIGEYAQIVRDGMMKAFPDLVLA